MKQFAQQVDSPLFYDSPHVGVDNNLTIKSNIPILVHQHFHKFIIYKERKWREGNKLYKGIEERVGN